MQAKPETLERVCKIVKAQLALPEGSSVGGESTFTDLGADSLDTVQHSLKLYFHLLVCDISGILYHVFVRLRL